MVDNPLDFNKFPYNLDLEKSILAYCAVIDPRDVIHELDPEDFYSSKNGKVFKTIKQQTSENGAVEWPTIYPDIITGVEFAEIMDHPIPSSLPYAMTLLKRLSLRRNAIKLLSSCMSACLKSDTQDPKDVIEPVISQLMKALSGNLNTSITIGNACIKCVENLENIKSGKYVQVSSGYRLIDNIIGGFEPGESVIIAGRPGMGKTAFSMGICENVGVASKRSLVFSLEMSSMSLAYRFLSKAIGVSVSQMKTKDVNWEKLNVMANNLSRLPIIIDDSSDNSINGIYSRCQKAKADGGLDVVFVDYIQLVKGEASGNREQEVASISRGLKKIAIDLDVVVFALSQLNRKLEDRANKRPTLSDLRESGAIEQDADKVVFIYRDSYYSTEDPTAMTSAEIIFAKNRNGPTGIAELMWVPWTASFVEPTRTITKKQRGNKTNEQE